MGAHGTGLFDDDDGADFAAEILHGESLDVITDALKAVPEEDWEYVEHPEGMRALLAAELIADQMGHDSGDLPDDLHSWIRNFGDAEEANIALARRAVDRILRNSETRDSWYDSRHFDEWEARTKNLARRLHR
jgi:hypothetical protein